MKKNTQKVTHFIDLLDDQEIATLYKHFTKVTQVKFKDRQDAEVRLLNATFGKAQHQIREALKFCKIPNETVIQFYERLRGPIAFPQGQMSAADLKKHTAALAAGKKLDINGNGNSKGLSNTAILVLLALKELTKKEEEQISSTDVAEKLQTNVNTVVKASEQLAKLNLITLEDDSNDGHQLYWLTLLPAGKEMEVSAPPIKLPAPNPGPRPGFAGKQIFKLVSGNPRREGTHGHKSFALIRDGMTYEEYRSAGGRNNDLAWDIEKKFVEMRDPGAAPPAKAAPPKKEKEVKAEPKMQSVKAEMAQLKKNIKLAEERAGKVVKAPVKKVRRKK